MREVRVESLEGLEVVDGEVRLIANSGDLALVFPPTVWEDLGRVSLPLEPGPEELEDLDEIKHRLLEHAREHGFSTIVEDVPCGGEGSGERFDLVLRSTGMFAATTGYVFSSLVSGERMARLGEQLDGETFVEGTYFIGAVVESEAFAAADESLKALSVRDRRCSSSRFELAPELWQVLSEGLGWKNVEPVAPTTTTSSPTKTEKRNH